MWVEDSFKDIFIIQQSIEDKIITQKEINDINMEKILLSIRDPQLKKDFEMAYNELSIRLNSWEKEINIETKLELKILKDVIENAGNNIIKNNKENTEENKGEGINFYYNKDIPSIKPGTPWYWKGDIHRFWINIPTSEVFK